MRSERATPNGANGLGFAGTPLSSCDLVIYAALIGSVSVRVGPQLAPVALRRARASGDALEQRGRHAQILERRLRKHAAARLDDARAVDVLVGVHLVGAAALAELAHRERLVAHADDR